MAHLTAVEKRTRFAGRDWDTGSAPISPQLNSLEPRDGKSGAVGIPASAGAFFVPEFGKFLLKTYCKQV